MKPGQREIRQGIGVIAAVLTAALILVGGCGSVPDDQAAYTGSQFSVASVVGQYLESSTNQVDVVAGLCDDEPEPYSDHFVEVAFLNRPLPNATEQTGSMITVTSAEIRYTPLDAATAPFPLPSPLIVEVRGDNTVPICGPGETCNPVVITGVYFVPVSTKAVLRGFLTTSGATQLAYNASYVFKGTNDFGEVATAVGQIQFYVANYDNCGG